MKIIRGTLPLPLCPLCDSCTLLLMTPCLHEVTATGSFYVHQVGSVSMASAFVPMLGLCDELTTLSDQAFCASAAPCPSVGHNMLLHVMSIP